MPAKYLLFLFSSTLCFLEAKGQTAHGVITNLEGEKLPFVHVINRSKEVGSTSDVFGYFNIRAESGDSLLLSAVGYHRYFLILENFSDTLKVQMIRDTTLLQEVTVSGTRYQEERKVLNIDGLTSPENFKPIKPGAIKLGNSLNDDPNMLPVFGLHVTINGPISFFSKESKEQRKLEKSQDLMNENLLYHQFTQGEMLQFMCETFDLDQEGYLEMFHVFYQENRQLFHGLTEDEIRSNLIIYLSEKAE